MRVEGTFRFPASQERVYALLLDPAALAGWALVGLTLIGTLFSMYLTFLEPFVIGATCAWCLTSAVILTLLMLLSVRLPSRPLAAMPR